VSYIMDALVLGVEVARFGDDEAGICPRKGRDARTLPWDVLPQHRHDAAGRARGRPAQHYRARGRGVRRRRRRRRRRGRSLPPAELNAFDIQFGGKADRAQLPGTETAVYANKAPRCGARTG
jgi:hypothetical protein